MAKINLICDQCGGKVELDDAHEFGFCTFCKSKILIKEDTIINEITQNITKHVYGHAGKDVDELIAEGNNLLDIGDEKKANEKFRKATEVDPKSWEAWLGYAATGGDKKGYISCVPAYRNAYQLAANEEQEIETFKDMLDYLPDSNLSKALIKVYKNATPNKRHEMFDLVLGVIGCDESEVAKLVIDLCPDDWSAWLAKAKIRQTRVKWCELESGFFTGKKLPEHAQEVLEIFLSAYQLAKKDSEEAKKIVLAHIATMEKDKSYEVFYSELNKKIKREG